MKGGPRSKFTRARSCAMQSIQPGRLPDCFFKKSEDTAPSWNWHLAQLNDNQIPNSIYNYGSIWGDLVQGLVNVLIEHHPTIGDIITNKYSKVMWNKSPKQDIYQPLLYLTHLTFWLPFWTQHLSSKKIDPQKPVLNRLPEKSGPQGGKISENIVSPYPLMIHNCPYYGDTRILYFQRLWYGDTICSYPLLLIISGYYPLIWGYDSYRFISIHIAIMDVHPQFQTQSLEQLQTIVAPIRWSFCGSMARLDAAINGHFRYTLVEWQELEKTHRKLKQTGVVKMMINMINSNKPSVFQGDISFSLKNWSSLTEAIFFRLWMIPPNPSDIVTSLSCRNLT